MHLMKPTILLDKSVLQAMNMSMLAELARFFWTTVSPLIVLEILGDLRKYPKDQERAAATVSNLASKVSPLNSAINADANNLCIRALLGFDIQMDRRTLVDGFATVDTPHGSVAYHRQDPVSLAVLRWETGCFSEAESVLADQWRRASRSLDLEALRKQLGFPIVRLTSLQDALAAVDRMLGDRLLQCPLLKWFLGELQPPDPVSEWALHRWRVGGFEWIRQLSPFIHHCLRVELFFSVGLQHELIGTRSSNRIDMQYYWYAPFAQVFSSSDKLHQKTAPLLLGDDQLFILGNRLLQDLRDLSDRRTQLSKNTRDELARIRPGPETVIAEVWERFMPPGALYSERPNHRSTIPDPKTQQMIKEIIDSTRAAETRMPPQRRWPI